MNITLIKLLLNIYVDYIVLCKMYIYLIYYINAPFHLKNHLKRIFLIPMPYVFIDYTCLQWIILYSFLVSWHVAVAHTFLLWFFSRCFSCLCPSFSSAFPVFRLCRDLSALVFWVESCSLVAFMDYHGLGYAHCSDYIIYCLFGSDRILFSIFAQRMF